MTNTDTSTNVLQQIESTLSSDWQKFVAFIQIAEQEVAAFLTKVAAGEQIIVADIEAAAGYVAGHLSTINAAISAAGELANAVAPGNAAVAKVLTDLTTGAQDVADLHNALTNGSSPSDPTIVTQAVTAISSAQNLAQLVANASATLTALVQNSPSATEAVTPASASPAA